MQMRLHLSELCNIVADAGRQEPEPTYDDDRGGKKGGLMGKDRNGSTGAQADRLDVLCSSVDALTHEREGSPETQPEFEELVRTIWRLR